MLWHGVHTLTAPPPPPPPPLSSPSPPPPPLPCTDRPLCAGTDEICMHVRLDYTRRLWEPGPLRSPLHRSGPAKPQALLSISDFKHISQLNWLRNTQNQRLNSWIFFSLHGGGGCVGKKINEVSEFLPSCLLPMKSPSPPSKKKKFLHPSAVRFITRGDNSVRKG